MYSPTVYYLNLTQLYYVQQPCGNFRGVLVCTGVQMYSCTVVHLYRCVQVYSCTAVQVVQVYRWTGVHMNR